MLHVVSVHEYMYAVESEPCFVVAFQVPHDAIPDHKRVRGGDDNPPNWKQFYNYSHATFMKLEVQEQDRRAVEVDDSEASKVLVNKSGRERELFGPWFTHWRRGVRGALQSWAKGSRSMLISMLTSSARAFGVATNVATGTVRHAHLISPPFPHTTLLTCVCACFQISTRRERLTDTLSTGSVQRSK